MGFSELTGAGLGPGCPFTIDGIILAVLKATDCAIVDLLRSKIIDSRSRSHISAVGAVLLCIRAAPGVMYTSQV